jgi:hypothetical protein
MSDPNDIWAPKPIPATGEDSAEVLFTAVGAALSEWEQLEAILALLFGVFLGEDGVSLAAQRAYGSVIAFSGRLDLLRGAASGYFEKHPDDTHEPAFEKLANDAKRASARRNEIAHGQVGLYPRWVRASETTGYLLMPGSYSVTKNDARWEPKYGYMAATVHEYGAHFRGLAEPAASMLVDLIGKHQAQRAGRIPPSTPKPGSLSAQGLRRRPPEPSEA